MKKDAFNKPDQKKHRPRHNAFIIGFVIFHVFALALFAIPIDLLLTRQAREAIAPYMRCIGMTDTWDTFAPNPKSAEQFLKAIVITKSGEYKLYSFPRMEDLSLTERYSKERYRKFVESILCSECAGLWPDVDKAVARQLSNPIDPPVKVILIKFESAIDPTTGSLGDDAYAKPTILSQIVIKAEELR